MKNAQSEISTPSQPQTHLSFSANWPRYRHRRGMAVVRADRRRRRVQLVDAVGANLIGSVRQPLTELALDQHALLGREARMKVAS